MKFLDKITMTEEEKFQLASFDCSKLGTKTIFQQKIYDIFALRRGDVSGKVYKLLKYIYHKMYRPNIMDLSCVTGVKKGEVKGTK